MKTITVIFKDPKYNYTTSMNGDQTDDQIKRNFIGKFFNFHGAGKIKNFQLCVRVKIKPYNI
jgi:hypothetical protein